MILKTLKLHIGHMNLVTNCYIIVDEETKETMVIDPGAEPEKIIEMLEKGLTTRFSPPGHRVGKINIKIASY